MPLIYTKKTTNVMVIGTTNTCSAEIHENQVICAERQIDVILYHRNRQKC